MKEAEAQELEVLKRSLWQFLQSTGTHRNRMSALHTSQTAEVACFMRHLAHLKSDDAIRGDDSMAVHFLFPEHAMLATSAASSEVLTQIYALYSEQAAFQDSMSTTLWGELDILKLQQGAEVLEKKCRKFTML